MSELDSLLRVRQHTIEQKQKALAALYKQAEDLKNERDALETQLAIEREKTAQMDMQMQGYFIPYSKKVKAKIIDIDAARGRMENRIKFAQDDMRDAFAEMKKIEIIDERRKAEELARIEKMESELLDEIAIDIFRRNNSE